MARSLVPMMFVILRNFGLGEGAKGGRWKTAAVVTIAAVIAFGSAAKDGTSLVLAGCGAVFTALGYLLLEDHAAAEVVEWIQLGKDTGLYLSLGFAIAAVAMENLLFEVFTWQGHGWEAIVHRNSGGYRVVGARVIGVGVLGAVRWILIPLLTSQCSIMSVAFLDLSSALVTVLFAAFSVVKAAATGVSVGGMLWWFIMGSGQQMRMSHAAMLLLVCALLVVCYTMGFQREMGLSRPETRPELIISSSEHPIPKLIKEAEGRYYTMRNSQSTTLAEAVQEYKRRYRMNPPPNFDKWYYFAKKRNVVIIDEYDTIYHSLKPFWGMPPKDIRERARGSMGFKGSFQTQNNRLLHGYIRGGEIQTDGQGPEWQKKATREMVESFVKWLPDMDLPFNIHDEPRVVVPFDALQQHLAKAEEVIRGMDLDSAKNAWTPLDIIEKAIPSGYTRTDWNVSADQGIWWHSTLSCPPDSPVQRSHPASKENKDTHSGQLLGFVVNATESSDICISPSLQNRHGFFDRPNTFHVVKRLYPVFSQSKVSSFGDIIYPSPWYWAHKVSYDNHLDPPWEHKIEKLYWRGSTTGGYSQNGGWKRHHRQRVVATIDANDTAKILQQNHTSNNNDWSITEVPRESLKELFDVYFSHIGQCDLVDCEEQKSFFKLAQVANQQSAWGWKYLLDVDGNAFSGRYYAFLKSRSVVFKLAVFREWHDEWLYPWVHYIPLTMELEEVAEIMRFFRYENEGERYAKRIADESRNWAGKVLRNEDLEVWLFRLLLEYGRVVDDNRAVIGYSR